MANYIYRRYCSVCDEKKYKEEPEKITTPFIPSECEDHEESLSEMVLEEVEN